MKDTQLKTCNKCQLNKPLEMFYKNKRRKDGFDTRCKECMDLYKSAWSEGKEDEIKLQRQNSRLIKRYGITSEDYKQILIDQDYKCAICGNLPEEGREASTALSVDHCHDSGEVRGLLCQKCNTGLGLLGDNQQGILKALEYLNKE